MTDNEGCFLAVCAGTRAPADDVIVLPPRRGASRRISGCSFPTTAMSRSNITPSQSTSVKASSAAMSIGGRLEWFMAPRKTVFFGCAQTDTEICKPSFFLVVVFGGFGHRVVCASARTPQNAIHAHRYVHQTVQDMIIRRSGTTSEACFLENVWKSNVRRARRASLAFIFWKLLPMDVIDMIANRDRRVVVWAWEVDENLFEMETRAK